jgi:hypothetical protein
MKKKIIYELLLRAVFSCFHGQKFAKNKNDFFYFYFLIWEVFSLFKKLFFLGLAVLVIYVIIVKGVCLLLLPLVSLVYP